MKKMNKKGFTIVELVIVIAVIAILAAVLIPTFSGVTKKAEASAITQETRAAVTILLAEKNGQIPEGTYIIYKDGSQEIWYQYNKTAGKLGDAMDSAAVTEAKGYFAAADDELYAKAATSAVFKNGEAAATIAEDHQLTDLSPHVEIFINVK